MHCHIKVEDVTSDGVSIVDKDGNKSVISCDTLVVSRGRKKADSLFDEIEDAVPEVYKIGDCSTAGNILKAIWTANDVARKI